MKKSSLIKGVSVRFNHNSEVAYFLGHPVYRTLSTLLHHYVATASCSSNLITSEFIRRQCTTLLPLTPSFLAPTLHYENSATCYHCIYMVAQKVSSYQIIKISHIA